MTIAVVPGAARPSFRPAAHDRVAAELASRLEARMAGPQPLGVAVRGLAFVPVARGLWRVTADSGAIRGHIERVGADGGDRYEVRRIRGDGASVPVGSFWNVRDAVDCFR